MSNTSDMMDRVKKAAEAQGFRVTRTSAGHFQFYAPNGKDIVTGAPPHSTATNGHSWANFMAQLRRAGFSDATTSLGDALKTALASPVSSSPSPGVAPTPPAKAPAVATPTAAAGKRTVREMVLEVLRRHIPAGIAIADLEAVIRSQRAVGNNSVASTLSLMKAKGEVTRVGAGFYRLASPATKEVNASAATTSATPSASHAANETTGDERVDADLAELDAALASLARIEAVVRRTREKLFLIAKTKKALDI